MATASLAAVIWRFCIHQTKATEASLPSGSTPLVTCGRGETGQHCPALHQLHGCIADGKTVFQGQATGPVWNPDTQEHVYTADFSKVKEPGDYQLEVPGLGQSAPFRVAADVYREPFYLVMRGFYLWRCGTAVSATYLGETFAHAACHTNDAWLDYVGGVHTNQDSTKGWHDAGDYNKYVVNAGSRWVPCFAPGKISGRKSRPSGWTFRNPAVRCRIFWLKSNGKWIGC
jgi:hypothetical protein